MSHKEELTMDPNASFVTEDENIHPYEYDSLIILSLLGIQRAGNKQEWGEINGQQSEIELWCENIPQTDGQALWWVTKTQRCIALFYSAVL